MRLKLVPKLTFALVAGMCVVLAVNGFFRVRRETTAFEAERLRRHVLIGQAVGAAVRASWRTDGEEKAVETLHAAVARYPSLEARWIPSSSVHADVSAQRTPTNSSDPVTTVDRTQSPSTSSTCIPIIVDGEKRGEIELVEKGHEQEDAREVIIDTLETAIGLAALSALIAFALGHLLVGTPVRRLRDKARAIGRGEFGEPIRLRSQDELDELSREMNAMCERLVGTLEQLRHADRLATVGKLASGLAHELGTPLNVVSARAEMLLAPDANLGPVETRDYARVIAKAAERMTVIISQLLQFARRKGIERSTSDPVMLARDAIDLLRPLAKKRGVAVDLVAGSCQPISVDTGQLQQVVTNLVMNAIQASATNSRIVVSVDEQLATPPADIGGAARDCTRFVVKDEGMGIEEDHLPRVFEPFFTTKEVGEGTGLGLAVSWGIVRDHHGWMNVETEKGVGSTFSVFLPREIDGA